MARRFTMSSVRKSFTLATQALRLWTARQYLIAAVVAIVFALVVGIATVLIPNPLFARDIDTEWWNYPVWILTSIGAGLLTATYIKTPDSAEATASEADTVTPPTAMDTGAARAEQRSARMGIAGGLLTWFAVGCPVCNKIALLVLGYSGAITWFAPFQPVLAVVAMLLTGVALVWRLKGQVACSVRPAPTQSRTHHMEPSA